MLLEMKRHNYVTPTNYLELVSGYKKYVHTIIYLCMYMYMYMYMYIYIVHVHFIYMYKYIYTMMQPHFKGKTGV